MLLPYCGNKSDILLGGLTNYIIDKSFFHTFESAGWWSYEFCYGREVKQYHFENGAIQGQTISLGKFESDYDWETSEEWEASSKTVSKKRKHHSQYYVDGSVCDLNEAARKTEVRFKCDGSLKGTGEDPW